MLFLLEFILYGIGMLIGGVFLFSILFIPLTYYTGKNKIYDIIKLLILYLVVIGFYVFGTYCDLLGDKGWEDCLVPMMLYIPAITTAFALFFNHNSRDYEESFSNISFIYFGNYRPSITIFKYSSYFLILSMLLESILRIYGRYSVTKGILSFFNYVPDLLEIDTNYKTTENCSCLIIGLTSFCLIAMAISDFKQNGLKGFRSFALVIIIEISILLSFNLFVYYNYFTPINYYVTNWLVRDIDIDILQKYVCQVALPGDVEALGAISLGASYQTVDSEIDDYISSIEKDSIPYIFDTHTFIRCVSCQIDDNRVQAINFRFEKVRDHLIGETDKFGNHFIKDFQNKTMYEASLKSYYEEDNYHNYFMRKHKDSLLYEHESKVWEKVLSTIKLKYGEPIIVGSIREGDFCETGDRTYYWTDNIKFIKLDILRGSTANLTYIKSSYINYLIREKEEAEAVDAKRFQDEINEYEAQATQDSIKKDRETQKCFEDNKIISDRTIGDL